MAKEKCVACGKETEYDVDTPIEMREGYVEGAGQLCKECDEKIYGKRPQIKVGELKK